MPNIFDYLEWRCDIPFSADPFNDVDNLVLSQASYTLFRGAVPEDGSRIPLKDVHEAFFTINSREELMKKDDILSRSSFLMDGMIRGDRFGRMKLADHVDIVDVDRDMQMSAVTYILDDGTAFIAFRGTDNTITGWKEDFNMSFLPVTQGQKEAVDYLNRVGKKLRRPIRVGGHSKGGNFAVYASAFCDPKVRDKIIEVYCNDSPGFRTEITESEEYAKVSAKVKSIVPDTSVIGMLLSSKYGREIVVQSSAKGLLQHDAMTWQVERNRFVTAEQSDIGRFVRDTQKDWLSKIDDETRASIVNSVFTLIEATGAGTFGEMSLNKLKAVDSIMSKAQDLPRDKQMELLKIAGELLQSGGQTAWKSLEELRREREESNNI